MLRRLKRSGKAGFAGTLSEHHDYLLNLISVQSTGRTRSSSLVTLARPPVSSSLGLQITKRSLTDASPHLWNQHPSSFRQLFTLLPVHLILCISVTSFALILSLPRPFTHDLKLISFTNPFTLFPSRLPSWILTCTELGALLCLF